MVLSIKKSPEVVAYYFNDACWTVPSSILRLSQGMTGRIYFISFYVFKGLFSWPCAYTMHVHMHVSILEDFRDKIRNLLAAMRFKIYASGFNHLLYLVRLHYSFPIHRVFIWFTLAHLQTDIVQMPFCPVWDKRYPYQFTLINGQQTIL